MKTDRFFNFSGILLLFILIATLFVSFNSPTVTMATSEGRIDRECSSPKFELGREQGLLVVTPFGDKGFRVAGCPGVKIEVVEKTQVEITTTATPTVPVCTSLFLSTGPIVPGTLTAGGGVVTQVEGNWSVEMRDGVLLAEHGKTFLVNFPENVVIHSVAVYDNDPKPGETGWTLNNISLPTTESNQWASEFVVDLTASQLYFSNGNDSPHIGICIE